MIQGGKPIAILMSITDDDLEEMRLSSDPEFTALIEQSRDRIMVLVAQSLTFGATDFIIATTNIRHLARFIAADIWQNISED